MFGLFISLAAQSSKDLTPIDPSIKFVSKPYRNQEVTTLIIKNSKLTELLNSYLTINIDKLKLFKHIIVIRIDKFNNRYFMAFGEMGKIELGGCLNSKSDDVFGITNIESGPDIIVFGEAANKFFEKLNTLKKITYLQEITIWTKDDADQLFPAIEPSLEIHEYIDNCFIKMGFPLQYPTTPIPFTQLGIK